MKVRAVPVLLHVCDEAEGSLVALVELRSWLVRVPHREWEHSVRNCSRDELVPGPKRVVDERLDRVLARLVLVMGKGDDERRDFVNAGFRDSVERCAPGMAEAWLVVDRHGSWVHGSSGSWRKMLRPTYSCRLTRAKSDQVSSALVRRAIPGVTPRAIRPWSLSNVVSASPSTFVPCGRRRRSFTRMSAGRPIQCSSITRSSVLCWSASAARNCLGDESPSVPAWSSVISPRL